MDTSVVKTRSALWHSHLARDVIWYAGETPGELAAACCPTPATALGAGVDR